ncbi:ROK family protein [soil metagenome]
MARAPGPTRHVGLDLGVTNLKWAVLERDADASWRVLDEGQLPTEANRGARAVVELMARTVQQRLADWPGVVSCGVGVPGLYDPAEGSTRDIINMPEPAQWAGLPVAGPMYAQTGLPTFLVNDARAFGLAELRLGAGRGARSMVGLTLGTGIGGVIAIGGSVLQGHDGTAGEAGHQTLDPDGPSCNCGNNGCLEAFARADRLAEACATTTPEEAFERARAGNQRARDGLARVGRYLGIGVANLITLITPDIVVLGGGVSAAGDLLFGPMRQEIARRVHVTALDQVKIRTAELGTRAGAIGAAVHGAERAAEDRAAADLAAGGGA